MAARPRVVATALMNSGSPICLVKLANPMKRRGPKPFQSVKARAKARRNGMSVKTYGPDEIEGQEGAHGPMRSLRRQGAVVEEALPSTRRARLLHEPSPFAAFSRRRSGHGASTLRSGISRLRIHLTIFAMASSPS